MTKRRRDSKGRVLKKGEQELANGTYRYDYIMKNSIDTPKFMRTANRQSEALRAIILSSGMIPKSK